MLKEMKNKLLIFNIVIIFIIMFFSFAAIYAITYITITNNDFQRLEKISYGTFNNLRDPDSTEEIYSEFETEFDTSFNLLVNRNGEVQKISSNLMYENDIYIDISEKIFSTENTVGQTNIGNRTWLYSISKIPQNELLNDYIGDSEYRISFLDITSSLETLDDLLFNFGFVGIAMLIIIYFVSLIFANKSIKPVEEIWEKQTRFVADATHELKTPLTIISANTDLVLLNKNEKVKSQEKWLNYIKNEVTNMNKLVNELLSSAKAEEEKYILKDQNISTALNETLFSFETIAFEKNIEFKSKIDKNIKAYVDIEKFSQIVKILLDNAIKYTDPEGKIYIKLYKVKKDAVLEVINSGMGIDEKNIPYIFDRFYKGDESRTNRESSYGLGLFIAKTIVNKMQGNIECQSVKNKETKFIVKFKVR